MKNCPYCGTPNQENSEVCVNCGGNLGTRQAPRYQAQSDPSDFVGGRPRGGMIPIELRPVSAWGYFGYTLLYSLPIVGWVFLIVFSISGANINRRNHARSYFCALLVFLLVLIIAFVVCLILGVPLNQLLDYQWWDKYLFRR